MRSRLREIEMTDITIENLHDRDDDEGPVANARSPLTSSNRANEGGLSAQPLAVPLMKKRSVRAWIKEALNVKIDHTGEPRTVALGCSPREWNGKGYGNNAINNRRYSFLTFLPLSLLNQFKSFFNVFYLFLAFSQFVPSLQVGFIFTYFSPLALVVLLSLLKDGLNELQRYRRDRQANREVFEKLVSGGTVLPVRSSDIKVGDLLVLHSNQRIPADCVLLHTTESTGTCFVRTDQLDGETDWKLHFPLNTTRHLSYNQLSFFRANIRCEPLHKDIYKFVGVLDTPQGPPEAVGLENTVWASCVVASSGSVVAAVIHTGADTRVSMNSAKPRVKRGLIDHELNTLGILCFVLLAIFSFLLVANQHFSGDWVIMFIRFFILMSAMIPISMRVNVDVGRLWYSYEIGHDRAIAGTVARNSDLPEELGRLQFLFSDKTGTLTKNKMEFRVLQLGPETVLTDRDTDRLLLGIREYFHLQAGPTPPPFLRNAVGAQKLWNREVNGMGEMIKAMVLCHNVNPVWEEEAADGINAAGGAVANGEGRTLVFQASSPDEVALVRFCHSLGVTLTSRSVDTITFTLPSSTAESCSFEVVKMFPFTSERKSMGILVRELQPRRTQDSVDKGQPPREQGEYTYYMKGADVKMVSVVRPTEWLEECCQELAQVGLRTLVFASRVLSEDQVNFFLHAYNTANATIGEGRSDAIAAAMRYLETDMTLCGVTGVEDELQDDVVMSLETLGMCGIKVWILTGDKVETAATIGRSTRLIPRHGAEEYLVCRTVEEARLRLYQLCGQYGLVGGGGRGAWQNIGFRGDGDLAAVGENEFRTGRARGRTQSDGLGGGGHLGLPVAPWTLILDGGCLSLCLTPELAGLFVMVARSAYSVVVARCSPTQKATVVQTMRKFSPSTVRMAAIGDGGNDVAMILAANVGIGIEGVEGKQASMAADFSITKFSHCLRLIMWHGRNTYRRTCRLSQFIMHRGIVYSVVQAAFSVLFSGTTMSVFNGYLLMGYSTIFTMAPAFALVLDEDFKETDVEEYPHLYRELVKSRSMNVRTFLQWVWVSIFQGGVMLCVALQLFRDEMFQIVTIAYTSLLITELVIVGSTVHLRTLWRQRRSHFWLFLAAEGFSLFAFFMAVLILPDTFDREFFFSWDCWWRVFVICLASIGPLWVFSLIGKHILFNKRVITPFFKAN